MSLSVALGLRAVNSGLSSLRLACSPTPSWLSSKSSLPQLPKRPLNPYLRFVNQARTANPSLFAGGSHKAGIKKASEQWNSMSEEERRPYQEGYLSDMQRWKEETAAVEAHLQKADMLEEVKAAAMGKKAEKSLKKAAKAKRDAEADLGKPKRPPTPFLVFFMEQHSKHAGMNITDKSRAVGERWKAMAEEEKAVYFKRAEEARSKYANELKRWEDALGAEEKEKLDKVGKKVSRMRSKKRELAKRATGEE